MGKRNCLKLAEEIVDGARNDMYGHPFENASGTADLWTAFLRPKLKEGEHLTPEEIPLMMMLLKVVRERNNPGINADNLVDIAGYARTAEMVNDYFVDAAQELIKSVDRESD